MAAQQQHDLGMANRVLSKGSGKRLKALLEKKRKASSAQEPYFGLDPIAQAMRNNPGLTRETAEQMAEDFGF